ncbi:MAG: hypothetical protein EPO27_10420 [Betaproteobacteria bacterium]|nr:MAG: hypothetical protein EPO27_10420 [Betaproteobacteria bacterium]
MSRPVKPERIGFVELLLRAAAHVHVNAECLRRSSTCRGKWFDREDLDLYNEEIALEKHLRRAAAYWKPNPLGGPAKLFETVADYIRAGDPIEDVLRDYGLQYIRKPTNRRNRHAQNHRHP